MHASSKDYGSGAYRGESVANGEAIVEEGSHSQFFRDIFLPGYLKNAPEYYTEIDQFYGDFVPLIVGNGMVSHAENITSIARAITYHKLTGSIPKDYWDLRRQARQRAAALREANTSRDLTELAESLITTDPDGDFKLQLVPERTIKDLGRWFHQGIVKKFRATPIQSKPVGRRDSGITKDEFSFKYSPNFKVLVTAGPIDTNYQFDRLTLALVDRNTGLTAFHFDFTELSFAGGPDRRSVLTIAGQDLISVKVFEADGDIRYRLPQRALDALQNPEVFRLTKANPGKLADVGWRGLRGRITFPYPTTQLLDLQTFVPGFVMKSAFENYRRYMHEMAATGVKIPRNEIPLPRKESLICAMGDPFLTAVALFDLAYMELMPGRDNIKVELDEVLRSDDLALIMKTPTEAPTPQERDWDYINECRLHYLGLANGSSRRFDGFELLMRALGAKKGEEWVFFDRLWRNPEPPVRYSTSTREIPIHKKPRVVAQIGPVQWVVPEGEAFEIGQLNVLEVILNAQREFKPKLEMIDSIVGPTLEIANQLRAKGFEVLRRSLTALELEGMIELHSILQKTSAGLTPREFQKRYEEAIKENPRLRHLPLNDFFQRIFYFYKCLGMSVRRERKKPGSEGVFQGYLTFYSVRKQRALHLLGDVIQEPKFVDLYYKELKRNVNPNDQSKFDKLVNAWLVSAIPSVEALACMEPEDFQLVHEFTKPLNEETVVQHKSAKEFMRDVSCFVDAWKKFREEQSEYA